MKRHNGIPEDHDLASLRTDAAADRAWESLIERVDYDGAGDPAELLRAQEQLSLVTPDPVEAGQITALVARSTGRQSILHRSWVRRMAMIAASIPAALLLAAAGTVTVLWLAGTFSSRTMNYALAIQVLQRDDLSDALSQRSALKITYLRVKRGIEALREITATAAPQSRSNAAAKAGLESLRQALVADAPEAPAEVADDLADVSITLRSSANQDESARLNLIARVVALTQAGVGAIRHLVPNDDEVAGHKALCIENLHKLLPR